ncbi:MAG: twin-arginine translocation signal domain-containing protein, partial [Myxococcota bacterium]
MSRRKPYAIASDRFDTRSGQVMWRSLEEKEAAASGQTQALRKAAEAELPGGFAKGLPLVNAGGLLKKAKAEPADVSVDIIAKQPRVSRRGFLQASSAAGAALALQGCIRRPESNILPFSKGPEYTIPGIPQHFATVTARGNDALGLLVTSNEGRPTKIEGNPQHTSSMGRTDLRAQAQLWDLYDPDRSHGPAAFDGDDFVSKSWEDVDAALAALVEQHTADRGAGLVVLSAPTSSPSFIRIRDAFEARFPEASFHEWTSVPDGNFAAGAKIAFGEKLYPLFDLAPAEVVVALDSDFLGNEPGSVRNARSFAPRRALTSPDRQRMNRLYAVEATYSVTGAMADHRLRVKAARVGSYLRALAKTLADKGLSLGPVAGALSGADTAAFPTDWLGAVADDLLANRGKSVVIAGPRQPAAVHALAATINDALGNLGRTVAFFPPTDLARQEPLEGMRSFAERAESAKTVLVLGGNPVYDAPADVDVAALLGREGVTSIHLASHRNETSAAATLHVPESHELETWGDLRAADGIFSIQQPLIRPLWGSRSALEVLAHVAGERNWRGHAVVRKTFRASYPDRTLFETTWRRTLHAGLLAGTLRRPARVGVRGGAV